MKPSEPITPEGFPLPETRVISTARTIELIEGNLEKTNESLDTAVKQLIAYQELLKKAKRRLSQRRQGLVEAAGPKPTRKIHCAQGKGKNLRFSADCSCQKNGSCSEFKFPKFGELTGPNSEYQLVEDIGNDVLSGKLKSANVKGSLLKKKNAFYNNDSYDSFGRNKRKKPTGASAASSSTSSGSSKRVFNRGKSNNKTGSLIKNNNDDKDISLSSSGTASASLSSKDSSKKQAASGTENRGSGPSYYNPSTSSSTLGRNNSFSAPNDSSNDMMDILPPVTDFPTVQSGQGSGDGTPPTREISSGKNRLSGKDITGSQRLSDRSNSIFKIVSRRYRKSAYPVLVSPISEKDIEALK